VLREQATRNVERVEGRLRDGYLHHPDYAELGRSAENARLLLSLRAARGGSGAAAETVAW